MYNNISPPELGRKRSWIWKYFESVTRTTYRCNLCTAMLSIRNLKTNNMNRHFRLRHPSVYKAEVTKNIDEDKDETRSKIKKRYSWVWLYYKRLSRSLARCKLCSKNIQSVNSTDNLSRHLKIIHKKIGKVVGRKRSWIWKYFQSVTSTTYRCNLCNETLAISSSSTHNLNRHVRLKHSSAYKAEVTKNYMNEIEQDLSGENQEVNDKDKYEDEDKDKDEIRSRKRSWIWKYFESVTSTTCRCNLCYETLIISCSNTHNLKRHIRSKHSSVYKAEVIKKDINQLEKEWKNEEDKKDTSELEQELASENKEENYKDMDETSNKTKQRSSWVWSYFKRLSSSLAKCLLCSRNIRSGNSTGNLSRHLNIIHNKSDDKMNKRSSWVWSYFKRLSSSLARCNLCSKNIHSANSTGNLSRHLKTMHNKMDKVIDDHNWVWLVFETDEDDFFSCRICQYKIMKFEDIDKSVTCVLEHLKEEHGIMSGDQIIIE